MDPVKTTHGMPQGWLTAEQPAPGDHLARPEGAELAATLRDATMARLDASAFGARGRESRG